MWAVVAREDVGMGVQGRTGWRVNRRRIRERRMEAECSLAVLNGMKANEQCRMQTIQGANVAGGVKNI